MRTYISTIVDSMIRRITRINVADLSAANVARGEPPLLLGQTPRFEHIDEGVYLEELLAANNGARDRQYQIRINDVVETELDQGSDIEQVTQIDVLVVVASGKSYLELEMRAHQDGRLLRNALIDPGNPDSPDPQIVLVGLRRPRFVTAGRNAVGGWALLVLSFATTHEEPSWAGS